MKPERLVALAHNAARAMVDKDLSHEERAKITNPPEVEELGEDEYRLYQELMIKFMRGLAETGK